MTNYCTKVTCNRPRTDDAQLIYYQLSNEHFLASNLHVGNWTLLVNNRWLHSEFFQVFSDVTRLITHFWSQNSLRICNTSILMSGFHGSHANPLSMHSGPSSYLNALDKWMKNRVKKTYNLNKKSSFKSWSFFLVHLLYILYFSWTCFVLLLNVFFLKNCLLWNEYKFNQRINRL